MTLQEVLTALRNADAAGDVEAAKRLAQIADSLKSRRGVDVETQQLEARLAQLQSQKPQIETTLGGNIKELGKGLAPGAIGLLETAGTGISALLPEDTEKSMRASMKEMAESAKKPFEAAEGYEDSVGRKLGEGLGSTLPFFIPGAGLVGVGLRGALGVAAGAGEARQAAEAAGATKEERAKATMLGAPTGLLDMLAPNVGPLKTVLGKELGPISARVATALARGGMEGATEAAQKVAQNLIAKGVYDPNQPIMAGSGEEGAYGAGVGALASLIVDLTVGRKSYAPMATPKPTEEKPEEPGTKKRPEVKSEAPIPPARIGYDVEPFTPVTAPDGSVFTTREDFEAYKKSQARAESQREEDRRTSDPLAGLTEGQRELARGAKQASLEEAFAQEPEPGQLGLPGIERADGTVEVPGRGRVKGETQEEVTTAEEPQVIPERDQYTRDLVDEAETAQIEEMLAAEAAPEVTVDPERERLQFESDIAELDGQIQAKEQKSTEDARLALLLPLIENDISNLPRAFAKELKAAGFTDLTFTERERNLISRAYDVRGAEPATPEVEPSAPAENAPMEALIPEKKTQRAPEQPSFPGMGKPKGPAPQAFSEEELAAQEEQPFSTMLTGDVLDKTGLPRQSGFYKQLIGMNMADQSQWPALSNIFAQVRTNPNVKPATKQAIERLAMQAFGGLATQQDLFPAASAPSTQKQAPAKEAPSGTAGTRSADTGNDNRATGTRAEGSGPAVQQRAEAAPAATTAKRTEAPEPTGLGDTGQPVSDAGKREGEKPGALTAKDKADVNTAWEMLQRAEEAQRKAEEAAAKAEKAAEQKAEPKAEKPAPKSEPKAEKPAPKAKAKTVSDENAYQLSKDVGEADYALETLAADAYLNSSEDYYSDKRVREMLADLEDGKIPDLKFGTAGANGPGTGGKYAREFLASLNPAEKQKFIDYLKKFLYGELRTKEAMQEFNRQQQLAREELADLDDSSPLFKDSRNLATTLHPLVLRMLKGNNLTAALRLIAGQNLGRASDIARSIADKLAGVQVEIVDFSAKNPTGLLKKLLDAYPHARGSSGASLVSKDGTRTLLLDSKTGLDVWTLLHEAHHPLIDATLDNPAHPLTKQLQQLFNDVKGSLGTAYGATDLKEFAAEARSNPTFQRVLASINPKGQPFTAWQKYVHSVKNFLRGLIGLQQKSMDSALDSADYMIEAIISGHSTAGATLQSASLLNKGEKVLDGILKRAEKLPLMNAERADTIDEFLTGKAKNTVKNIVRQSLPLNALVEVAKKYIPMAYKLDVLVGEKHGAENKRNQMIEPIVNRVSDWAKNNPDKMLAFNNVVHDSTRAKVDPSKPRSTYAGKMDSSGNKLDEEWDALQADWKAIGPEGQSMYKQMRDTYRKMYDSVRAVIEKRVDDSVPDEGVRRNIKNELYERLFKNVGEIDPYFPLARSGKYWMSYTLGAETYVEAFETSRERDRVAKEVEAEGARDIQQFMQPDKDNYRNTPAASLINDVLRSLEASKIAADKVTKDRIDAVSEDVVRLFLNALPEVAFAQAFRYRKGTLGEKRDAVDALRTKAFNLSRQLTNMEYGAKFSALRQEIKDYVKSQGNKDAAVEMMNELNARIDYAASPQVPQWSKIATSTGFFMTLGFNVSSALVNLSQIPLVVMPYLGGTHGFANTAKAVGRATKLFMGSGMDREVEMLVPTDKGEKTVKVKAFPSIDNYDFNAKGAPKHLKALVEVAGRRGQLTRSQTYDILEVDESQSALTKINAASGFVFHHAERMNRQVSLVAAYELELQRLVGKGKDLNTATEAQMNKAAEYAVDMTELTNGGTAAAAAPRIAQNALGRVLFMYKRYGVSMYYMLFKTTRDMFEKWQPDPEVRKAAKRQIAGIYASSALMAGVQGIPMYGVAAMVYNMFKGDDEDDFDTAAQKYLSEGVYSGALNAMTGLQLSGRIGLSDLLYRDTVTKPSDSAIWSFLETAGGPVIGVASRVERGIKLMNEGHFARGMEQIMPSAVGNALKAVRFGTEGANTLRGDPITGEMGAWNVGAQFFGFAPADYTRQLEINSSAKNIERNVSEERTKLLKRYYLALRVGDSAEVNEVVAEMMKFNARRKDAKAIITPDVINRSMAQHMKTTQEMYHGISLNKSIRGELMQHINELEEE